MPYFDISHNPQCIKAQDYVPRQPSIKPKISVRSEPICLPPYKADHVTQPLDDYACTPVSPETFCEAIDQQIQPQPQSNSGILTGLGLGLGSAALGIAGTLGWQYLTKEEKKPEIDYTKWTQNIEAILYAFSAFAGVYTLGHWINKEHLEDRIIRSKLKNDL